VSSPYPPQTSITGWLARAGRVFVSLLLDLAIVIGSYALALYLKFDGHVPSESWNQLVWAGPLIAFAYILAYQSFGVYRTAWQYGSIRDAVLLALAVAVVTAGILSVNLLLPKRPIPLTVNVISAAFILLFHGMARLLPRLWSTAGVVLPDLPQQRVLIVGAGATGQMLAAELLRNRAQPYRPVGFVDQDQGLRGKRIHGLPVLGGWLDIPEAIEKQHVDLVAIALAPDATAPLQDILALVELSKVPVRLVPGLADIMEGRAARGEMRELTMEDLLDREPIDISRDALRQAIEGRVVLITGAAGSIGTELSRMVALLKPAALHLLDTNETGLHELRLELLQRAQPTDTLKLHLCSITDGQLVSDIFEASQPQVVFHLAAYKMVPMMEDHPGQAFETNVLGTLNVFEAAQAVQAERVVFLSSHVAVNPVSVYGASKRVGELLATSMSGRTRFCAVRLTNVIDARGAVLGVFMRQIQRGAPITVTDPGVARYFLTIKEVVGAVIQAAAMTRGGEVFLLDVGDEVRIGELAERLSRSLEPDKDPEIVYTSLRPGEKLRENLIGEHERLAPTSHPKMQMAVSALRFSGAELRAGIRELEVDRRRRSGNLPARLHALARFDRAAEREAGEGETSSTEAPASPEP
jgi:FlaA1/EpsC-like NDP-sugar epimerase